MSHLEYQLHRGNLLQCFHQGTRNRETNSRVLFANTLIRQIWEDVFLKTMKIICINLDLSIIVSASFSNKLGITGRTTRFFLISTRTSSSTRRIIFEGTGSPRYSNPKYARNGRNE